MVPAKPALNEVSEAPEDRGRSSWSTRLRFGLAVLLVALLAAAFAVAFRGALNVAYQQLAQAPNVVQAMRRAPTWARIVAPALGGLCAGFIARITARYPASHGVSDVMEAVVLGRVHLSMRITLWKSLASFLAIASGGSLGREGPLIQFGGAAGKAVSQRLSLSVAETRLIIAAGTAAGFAAAYNTPIAAVLFVLEVVTGMVVLDAVLPTLIATVVASSITRSVVGAGPIYGQRGFHLGAPSELAAFIGMAVILAIGCQIFMRLLALGERAFERIRFLPLRSAIGGALAGGLIAWLPEVAGNGYEPLNALLDENYAVSFVALLLLGKCLATTASVSSGSPGGVFTPTLLVGGCLGFLYAMGLSALGITIGSPGGYALIGMAAATAATTHAPLMAAVMVFELSGDYAVVLPLVLVTALSTLVSRALRRDSIYGAELRRRGIRWEITMEGRRLLE